MSTELHDLRAKVTAETHVWLEAVHRVTGRDVAEIVRSHLHEIALRELRVASVMQRLAHAEGISGNERE